MRDTRLIPSIYFAQGFSRAFRGIPGFSMTVFVGLG